MLDIGSLYTYYSILKEIVNTLNGNEKSSIKENSKKIYTQEDLNKEISHLRKEMREKYRKEVKELEKKYRQDIEDVIKERLNEQKSLFETKESHILVSGETVEHNSSNASNDEFENNDKREDQNGCFSGCLHQSAIAFLIAGLFSFIGHLYEIVTYDTTTLILSIIIILFMISLVSGTVYAIRWIRFKEIVEEYSDGSYFVGKRLMGKKHGEGTYIIEENSKIIVSFYLGNIYCIKYHSLDRNRTANYISRMNNIDRRKVDALIRYFP